jgi:hypothetical protein
LELFLGYLGCARIAQQSIGNSIANARSVYLNYVESENNVPGGHTRAFTESRRILKVVEYLAR